MFWLSLLTELASWELVFWRPGLLWYWLILNLGAGLALSYFLTPTAGLVKPKLGDRLGFIIFNITIFYWLLWLDFGLTKYAIPAIIVIFLAYLLTGLRNNSQTKIQESARLVFFLGSTFFLASIAFGLVTVLGWPLWLVMLIFSGVFLLSAWPAIFYWPGGQDRKLLGYLALSLLAVESLAVLLWLPFTEVTLGLMLTIIILASYDLLKYFIQPELIVRPVIIKKVLVYVGFLSLILISTNWR